MSDIITSTMNTNRRRPFGKSSELLAIHSQLTWLSRPNMGRGRIIPDKSPKFHWTVKERKEKVDGYIPRARFRVEALIYEGGPKSTPKVCSQGSVNETTSGLIGLAYHFICLQALVILTLLCLSYRQLCSQALKLLSTSKAS